MSVRLVAHQSGQFVSALQQLFQALHQIGIRVEENPVGDFSHLQVEENKEEKSPHGTDHQLFGRAYVLHICVRLL